MCMFIDKVSITTPRTTSEFEAQLDHIHHDRHQLIFTHNNMGSISIDNQEFEYKPNHFYYAPKGVKHICYNKIGTNYSILFFTISNTALEKELLKLPYEMFPANLSFVKILISQMHMYKYSDNPISEYYMLSCFSMLLTSLINKSFYMPIDDERAVLLLDPVNYPLLNNSFEKLLEFIKSYFSVDIPIERMIKVSGYQRAQLFRLFKERLGTTPHNYLNKLRIDASKDLIADFNINITNIAFMVGFKSTAVFTRAFRYFEGCSPSEYRKHIKQQN